LVYLRPSIVRVAFSAMSLSKVTFAFDPQKTVAQEVIKRDEHRNIPKYFIVW